MFLNRITRWFGGRGRRPSVPRLQTTRLHVECLEGREVPALFGGLPGGLPTLLGPHPVVAEVGQVSLASPKVPGPKAALASAFQFKYTAITIRNSTRGLLNYSFRWGNGMWTNYALAAGQQRVHFLRALNGVARIAYDKSFAPGVQLQQYNLTGWNIVRKPGFYLREPTPTFGEGRLYTFRSVFNGVQLYS
jgi:hypothetical protein